MRKTGRSDTGLDISSSLQFRHPPITVALYIYKVYQTSVTDECEYVHILNDH